MPRDRQEMFRQLHEARNAKYVKSVERSLEAAKVPQEARVRFFRTSKNNDVLRKLAASKHTSPADKKAVEFVLNERECDGTHSHAPGACPACDQAFDELEGD